MRGVGYFPMSAGAVRRMLTAGVAAVCLVCPAAAGAAGGGWYKHDLHCHVAI